MTKISLIGDAHIGNKEFEEKKFKKALRDSEKIILMGDIIEGITKKDKRHHRNDCIMSVDEAILKAGKLINPHKHKVIHSLIGNHEDTLLTFLDLDAMKLIYDPLKIPYSYTEILTIDRCNIALSHGTGAGATYGGAVTQLEKFAKDYNAQFNCIGHTHKLFEITMKRHPNQTFTIVNTGTFLSGAQYADKMKLPPPVIGYIEIDTVTKTARKVLL